MDKDEFGEFCKTVLWGQFETENSGKFKAAEYVHMCQTLKAGHNDMDPDGCLPMILARPDGIWAPVRFGPYVRTQHSLLFITAGLGVPNDSSTVYGRIGFALLVTLFNLAISMAGNVSIFEGQAGTQIIVVTILDSCMVGVLRTLYLQSAGVKKGAYRCCMTTILMILVGLCGFSIVYVAILGASSNQLSEAFIGEWFATWITARLSEFFKLGFQWGLRKEYGGWHGLT